MGTYLTSLDLIIFFGSLFGVMALGLWAGWKEDDSTDFYLAGRTTRWWGVAGSIFGSNVSANHIVGMMGLGFSVGFAQSHFEITAIAGLLMLCYGFLPVYRKLNVFTLSEYLSRRYDDRARVAYAMIMIFIIVVVMMVPGFYIGSRSVNILLQEQGESQENFVATTVGTMANPYGALVTTTNLYPTRLDPKPIDTNYYRIGIILIAIVTGTYTILGGLKAVIMTDVIQSILILLAGITVAVFTFSQPEIGGWFGLPALDAAGANKIHLYLPSDHDYLPWTGVLTGLMVLHFYYWGTNQFVVQRALAAQSDKEARLGIITAGFFKLLIPFFSVGTGIAAFYMFQARNMNVAQDAVFAELMKTVVAPIGFGVVGLVAAGLIGAILSSLDSMMNSASTIVTFDIYRRFINPEATEKQLIWVGRLWIVLFITGAATMTIFFMDPNSESSFFLNIAKHQSSLIAGLVVSFGLGMLWKRATATAGVVAIVSGVVFSYGLPYFYPIAAPEGSPLHYWFGPQLNFMHSVFLAAILSALLHIIVSLSTQPDAEKSKLTWTELGGHEASTLWKFAGAMAVTLGIYAYLGISVYQENMTPKIAAYIAGGWTMGVIWLSLVVYLQRHPEKSLQPLQIIQEDRFWAGLLAGCAVFIMFFFW